MNELNQSNESPADEANAQRERLLDALQQAGAAGVLSHDLTRICNVPSVPKRISELRRAGHEIDTEAVPVVADDATVSVRARYVLRVPVAEAAGQ